MIKKHLSISVDKGQLEGDLAIPENAKGLVLFAHGSGSSHKSPRNQRVARFLQKRGIGTLLFDLLTLDEEKVDMLTGHLRFDIGLLSERLVIVTKWIKEQKDTKEYDIGYFGASTGAAAALVAAGECPDIIKAIVSRGGRPDLAGLSLEKVEAPTLFIVGGYDDTVIELNRSAWERLRVEKKMEIVPEATHLFEEPGKLDEVAHLAADWFSRYFKRKE